ncbi:FMN-linked oxidoreductase [Piedraia hortae CBS 480.64]|uniref:tRNA-dihydrouridine(47) synthase [NAD(P)(+)] n=1 Tax=Piedraia hortae CBS 480.64 TaxID=1314780 RepID=A0A6A7BXD0_9PEZI|nr:FMN-linked oxidoreductase [Piedraia hortae CBS 480.64]
MAEEKRDIAQNSAEESAAKRRKVDAEPGRVKGVAPIKKEYLTDVSRQLEVDDDAAEASGQTSGGRGGPKTKGGQNHGRQFGSSRDAIQLCKSRAHVDEFAPATCSFGDKCKFEHNVRKYLEEGKREDLQTFGGICPTFEARGKCGGGWRCRLVGSHSKEAEHEDGRKELVLLGKPAGNVSGNGLETEEENVDVVNVVPMADKIKLRKKQFKTTKTDAYLDWMHSSEKEDEKAEKQDHRAANVDPPLRPSEKRRIYYGPETPVLAPLTTQGNLPFRRLCVGLGAQVTWSEMAMGLPLIQGEKTEWALAKAHVSELSPPAYSPKEPVCEYDHSKDIRFGVQIAANKPWLALKTTEVLTAYCPHLRAIDLNCGCPIELVCRQGAGSAMLDTPGKLEKTLRGMNAVSGEVPITVKIRMGTKDKQPTAEKLCQKLVQGPSGVAAITLHGRSKQQRYTRSADWEYIAQCASLVSKLREQRASATDTAHETDERDLPASGLPYFCGNGDVLSHVDYQTHIAESGVDTCMIGRGALIKPWIFEEVSTGQYLDKSATERLGYIEQFARNGLEYWGSDEVGVGTTRRFLLEWLSFSCRYVPIGLLEYLPPKFGDRPPAFKGRSDLETLLSSGNYKDWIKISEMFLGPAHKDFKFQPKHKSNSYEMEAEG